MMLDLYATYGCWYIWRLALFFQADNFLVKFCMYFSKTVMHRNFETVLLSVEIEATT